VRLVVLHLHRPFLGSVEGGGGLCFHKPQKSKANCAGRYIHLSSVFRTDLFPSFSAYTKRRVNKRDVFRLCTASGAQFIGTNQNIFLRVADKLQRCH
jgi:hypothetical protein